MKSWKFDLSHFLVPVTNGSHDEGCLFLQDLTDFEPPITKDDTPFLEQIPPLDTTGVATVTIVVEYDDGSGSETVSNSCRNSRRIQCCSSSQAAKVVLLLVVKNMGC